MIPFNYHHLYYFWVTAKAGSITAASRRVLLAQPTLSLQLKQLEDSMKKKLFHRGRRGVVLTPEGREAFEYCERIFAQGEALIRSLREGVSAPPVLGLGVLPSISREIILQVMDSIQASDGRVRTAIFTGTFFELKDRLERRAVDVLLCDADYSFTLGREFQGHLAGSIPVHFVAPARGRRIFGKFSSPRSEIPMLFRAPENAVRKKVEAYLKRQRVRVSVAAETEDADLIRILCLRGRGIAALNALAIERDLAEGRLKRIHRRPTGIREYVWLISRILPHPDAVLQGVLQTLFEFRIKAPA